MQALEPSEDIILVFSNGKELPAHSFLLRLSSPVICEALSHEPTTQPNGKTVRLPVSSDSFEGWQHMLSFIQPHQPEPEHAELTLEAAQAALPVAAKYCIVKPIRSYTRHVEHVLLPSLTLKECVQWLDLFCHVCTHNHPIIPLLTSKCSWHVNTKTGLKDACGLLRAMLGKAAGSSASKDTNSKDTRSSSCSSTAASSTGSSAFVPRELHPLAATALLEILMDHVSSSSAKAADTPATQPPPERERRRLRSFNCGACGASFAADATGQPARVPLNGGLAVVPPVNIFGPTVYQMRCIFCSHSLMQH